MTTVTSLHAIITTISCLCASNNMHNVVMVNSNNTLQQYNMAQARQQHYENTYNNHRNMNSNNYNRKRTQRKFRQHNPYDDNEQEESFENDNNIHMFARANFQEENEGNELHYEREIKRLNQTISSLEYKLMHLTQILEDNFFVLRYGIQSILQASSSSSSSSPIDTNNLDENK